MLHGYIERANNFAGADTWQAAECFVSEGYLVLAAERDVYTFTYDGQTQGT